MTNDMANNPARSHSQGTSILDRLPYALANGSSAPGHTAPRSYPSTLPAAPQRAVMPQAMSQDPSPVFQSAAFERSNRQEHDRLPSQYQGQGHADGNGNGNLPLATSAQAAKSPRGNTTSNEHGRRHKSKVIAMLDRFTDRVTETVLAALPNTVTGQTDGQGPRRDPAMTQTSGTGAPALNNHAIRQNTVSHKPVHDGVAAMTTTVPVATPQSMSAIHYPTQPVAVQPPVNTNSGRQDAPVPTGMNGKGVDLNPQTSQPVRHGETATVRMTEMDTGTVGSDDYASRGQTSFGNTKSNPQLVRAWEHVVANLSIEAPVGVLQFETSASQYEFLLNSKIVQIHGEAGGHPFRLLVEPAIVETLVLAYDTEVSHFTDDNQDLAILCEFLARDLVERVEAYLRTDIRLKSAELVDEVDPLQDWYYVKTDVTGRSMVAALAISDGLMAEMERFVSGSASVEERAVAKKLRVKIGPVSLPMKEAVHTSKGDILDCGANPEGEIKGILERTDGKYWPIQIEDNRVVITGGMQSPLQPADSSEIIAGFEIGSITLAHHLRRNFRQGAKIGMTRLPEGRANVWFGERIHGSGRLDVVENSLCVELDSMGSGE